MIEDWRQFPRLCPEPGPRAIGRQLRQPNNQWEGADHEPSSLGPRVPRADWWKVTVGKKVWEVSHEPFACSERYKYKPHAESPTERLHPLPVAAAAAHRSDGF